MKRLLFPYVFISILVFLTMWYVKKVDEPVLTYILDNYVLAKGCRHLWFLVVLFSISVIFNQIDRMMYSFNAYVIILLILLYCIHNHVTYIFQIASIFKYMIFYYLGYHLVKRIDILMFLSERKHLTLLGILLLSFYYINMFTLNRFILIQLMLAIIGSLLFLGISMLIYNKKYIDIQFVKGIFEILHKNSFAIYLFHPIFIYLYFYIFRDSNLNPYILIWVLFLGAIFLSILLATLMRRIRIQQLIGES